MKGVLSIKNTIEGNSIKHLYMGLVVRWV